MKINKAVSNEEANVSSHYLLSGLPLVEMTVSQDCNKGGLRSGFWAYELRHEKKTVTDAGALLETSKPELFVQGALQAFGRLKKRCNVRFLCANPDFSSALRIELHPHWSRMPFEPGPEDMREVKDWSNLIEIARNHVVDCSPRRMAANSMYYHANSMDYYQKGLEAAALIDPAANWNPFG